MAFDALFRAVVRGRFSDVLPTNDETVVHATGQRELLVAAGKPSKAEIVRQGNSWWIKETSAVAPVVAIPTTTAQLAIQNTAPDGGVSLILESVFADVLVSAAAATPISLFGMLNVGKTTGLTQGALVAHSFSGKPAYGGVVKHQLAATVVNDGWKPLGNSVEPPASGIMTTIEIPLDGMFIVPPGGQFNLVVAANTVSTITVRSGIAWHEVPLTLG